MTMNSLLSLSTQQLRQAAEIKEQIEDLETQLARVLETTGATPGGPVLSRRKMSAAGRARMAAAAKARWAKARGEVPASVAGNGKRKMSAVARARISRAAKARWAAAKAAGKTAL